MLPPLFQILFGLSGVGLIIVRFTASAALKPLSGKLIGIAIVCQMLGLFLLSLATGSRSIGAGAELFAAAGAAIMLGVVLIVAGLISASKRS